jgi:hypothetical protein
MTLVHLKCLFSRGVMLSVASPPFLGFVATSWEGRLIKVFLGNSRGRNRSNVVNKRIEDTGSPKEAKNSNLMKAVVLR